jgi:glycosyltransferase involved in cell wall biosynthesis
LKVSLIIPNRNDTVMLGVSLRSSIEQLKSINNDAEIIVVDNSDEDIWKIIQKPNCTPCPRGIDKGGYMDIGLLKYLRQDFPSMYAAYDMGAKEAKGEYLMRCDSHVMWGHNVIKDCIDWMDDHPGVGFGFSPIGWWNLPEKFAKSYITKNDNGGIFGPWGKMKDVTLPMKIAWNFGFRIVRKDWYEKVGGFSFFADKQISWGGGEFYIAMKSWLLGRENWAMPAEPVYHIGPYSKEVEALGYRFRRYGSSGKGRQGLGILAAFYALGGDKAKEECKKSAEGLMSQYGIDIDRDWPEARRFAEEDHEWIKKHQIISFEELLEREPWNEKP